MNCSIFGRGKARAFIHDQKIVALERCVNSEPSRGCWPGGLGHRGVRTSFGIRIFFLLGSHAWHSVRPGRNQRTPCPSKPRPPKNKLASALTGQDLWEIDPIQSGPVRSKTPFRHPGIEMLRGPVQKARVAINKKECLGRRSVCVTVEAQATDLLGRA